MKNHSKSEIIEFFRLQVSRECSIPLEEVNIDDKFIDFGMDSLRAVFIMDKLEKFIDAELSPLYFWDHPTISSLTEFICTEILTDR
jgi:polyketide synthase PksN